MEIALGLFVLILLALLIGLIVGLWPVIVLVFYAVLASMVVSACGGIVLFLSLIVLSILIAEYLRVKGNLSKVVKVEFDGWRLSWFIDEELALRFADTTTLFSLCVIFAAISMVGILSLLKTAGYLKVHLWEGGMVQSVLSAGLKKI